MSAASLDIGWDTQNDFGRTTYVPGSAPRPGGPLAARRSPVRCPECDSIVYSRRHKLCGVCNQPLPEELLFTIMEAKRVEALLAQERLRHRKWLEQRARKIE